MLFHIYTYHHILPAVPSFHAIKTLSNSTLKKVHFLPISLKQNRSHLHLLSEGYLLEPRESINILSFNWLYLVLEVSHLQLPKNASIRNLDPLQDSKVFYSCPVATALQKSHFALSSNIAIIYGITLPPLVCLMQFKRRFDRSTLLHIES